MKRYSELGKRAIVSFLVPISLADGKRDPEVEGNIIDVYRDGAFQSVVVDLDNGPTVEVPRDRVKIRR